MGWKRPFVTFVRAGSSVVIVLHNRLPRKDTARYMEFQIEQIRSGLEFGSSSAGGKGWCCSLQSSGWPLTVVEL